MKVNPLEAYQEYYAMFDGMEAKHIFQWMIEHFCYLGRKFKRAFRKKRSTGSPFHA